MFTLISDPSLNNATERGKSEHLGALIAIVAQAIGFSQKVRKHDVLVQLVDGNDYKGMARPERFELPAF